jgi:hypothetical protein
MNSRSLTILPLIKTKPVIEHLNPVYIGIKQGIIITLMNGDGDQDNGDSLLISDLDFIKKQYIKIKGLVGADRRFDKIEIKGNLLHLNYTGWVPNSDPETIDQMAKIKLSNSP